MYRNAASGSLQGNENIINVEGDLARESGICDNGSPVHVISPTFSSASK
jgi:hypothetical protein